MSTFRRVEELNTRESFEGDYTIYDAFLYQGPYTDYAHWASSMFQEGKLRAPRAHELFISHNGADEANWPIEPDTWVMKVYVHKDGVGSVTLRNLTTEQLRLEFFPIETLGADENAAYFASSDAVWGRAVLQVSVTYTSFQWQGVLHQIPSWLQEAIIKGGVTVNGPSLYTLSSTFPARPGDWVLFTNSGGSVRIMTDAEYQKVAK